MCFFKNKARPLFILNSVATMKCTSGHNNVKASSMLSDKHYHYGNKVPCVSE